jgi:hypothetical protein
MANIGQATTKNLLDWACGGASPTAPAGRFLGLSLGSPTSVSNSEIATGSGYFRSTCMFGAAGTPTSSATVTNNTPVTFGPFSSVQSISGLFVNDSVSSGAGVYLFYGTLTNARTVSVGDSLVVASAALTITLA